MPFCFRQKHPDGNLQLNAVRVDNGYTTVFTAGPARDRQFLTVERVEQVAHLDRGTYGLMSALAGTPTSTPF